MVIKSVTFLQDEGKTSAHNVTVSLNNSFNIDSFGGEEAPVLIAGGGPSGLLQAYMLSRLRGMELSILLH